MAIQAVSCVFPLRVVNCPLCATTLSITSIEPRAPVQTSQLSRWHIVSKSPGSFSATSHLDPKILALTLFLTCSYNEAHTGALDAAAALIKRIRDRDLYQYVQVGKPCHWYATEA
jgi:hypothetical protein